MKNVFLIIAIVFSLTSITYAFNHDEGELSLVKTEKVELTLENISQKEFIISTQFNAEHENLTMKFEASVEMIQIYNDTGELEMMLPIHSTKINLGLSLFEDGKYKMGFKLEGIEDVQYTSLVVK